MIEIIENTEEARDKFSEQGWGRWDVDLAQEHLDALLAGKCIGIFDGEYTKIITLAKREASQ